jgi:hypothetical protein
MSSAFSILFLKIDAIHERGDKDHIASMGRGYAI